MTDIVSSRTVIDLGQRQAVDASVVGAKAANLARAALAGFPVLPGFVIPVESSHAIDWADVAVAWRSVSEAGERPLVVRSSSPNEDQAGSSMAGRFTSVVGTADWESFVAAVDEVVASADALDLPIAVLVQPLLEPRLGGVLFGAHPVTGATDRLLVSAVAGGPDDLVSGLVDGAQVELSSTGRVLDVRGEAPAGLLERGSRRQLVDLAGRTADVFGGPQDVEWAIDESGAVVLFQTRPITTELGTGAAEGPMFGPGPVAETFPDPLSRLEEQLWADPLRDAIAHALAIIGRKVGASPVLVAPSGRLAVDLELFGATQAIGRRRWLRLLDPRPPLRRLRVAWRVGRLRAGLPQLSRDLIAELDVQLDEVPDLATLGEIELLGVLDRGRQALTALHGYEILSGQLLDEHDEALSAASEALRLVARGRAEGLDDDDIVERWPVVLTLVQPAIGKDPVLPPVATAPAPPQAGDPNAAVREALRVRVRWLHELTARAAFELGLRLWRRGVLGDARLVVGADLGELRANVVNADPRPLSIETRASRIPPLPAAFRLDASGRPVPVRPVAGDGAGTGAGGGRSCGPVHQGESQAPSGSILVVPTLEPSLAGRLPDLGGLVAETGSVLSHVAILARELGVPAVVGLADATTRFPRGAKVAVDGITGEVQLVDEAACPDPEELE